VLSIPIIHSYFTTTTIAVIATIPALTMSSGDDLDSGSPQAGDAPPPLPAFVPSDELVAKIQKWLHGRDLPQKMAQNLLTEFPEMDKTIALFLKGFITSTSRGTYQDVLRGDDGEPILTKSCEHNDHLVIDTYHANSWHTLKHPDGDCWDPKEEGDGIPDADRRLPDCECKAEEIECYVSFNIKPDDLVSRKEIDPRQLELMEKALTTPAYSGLKPVYHPAPPLNWLTDAVWTTWQDLHARLNKNVRPQRPTSYLDAFNLFCKTLELMRITWPTTYENGKKHVKKGPYGEIKTWYTVIGSWIGSQRRHMRLPRSMRGQAGTTTALKLIGKIAGHFKANIGPVIRDEVCRLPGTGMVSQLLTDEMIKGCTDVPSIVALCLGSAIASTRNTFSLDPQGDKGGLNTWFKAIWDSILVPGETTRWDLISLVYPFPEVIRQCAPEWRESVVRQTLVLAHRIIPVSKYYWETMDVSCAIHNNMAVREGVPGTEWNCIAGAWKQIRRFLLGFQFESAHPIILPKCLSVIAHDQMRWAAAAGKGVHPDTAVFCDLAQAEVMPWTPLEKPDKRGRIAGLIRDTCTKHEVNPAFWTTPPKLRDGGAKMYAANMICGCAIPPVSAEIQELLIKMGAFGATPHTGN
jgi:hypothetical protein